MYGYQVILTFFKESIVDLLPFKENLISRLITSDTENKLPLDKIYIGDYIYTDIENIRYGTFISFYQKKDKDEYYKIPTIDFFKLIVGTNKVETIYFNIDCEINKETFSSTLILSNLPLSFQFDNTVLKSVDENNKPTDEDFTISSEVEISIDTDLNFSFNFLKNLSTKFAIGDTGFIVMVENLNFDFPKGKFDLTLKQASIIPPQFLLPKKDNDDTDSKEIVLPTLSLFDATINNQGFSGVVSVNWDLTYDEKKKTFYYDDEQNLEANFLGISGGFEHISLTFYENELVGSEITGKILIPYFNNKPLDITLNLITGDDKVDFTITLKSENKEGIELKKDELMALYMKSLSISKKGNSVSLTVDGGLQPLLWNMDGLEWPRLDVKGLGIEQNLTLLDGKLQAPKMKFKEAWVDLKELATLDLFGFHFELNKIGMGYIEVEEVGASDKMWLEFTGSLKLIEQLPMGVAVEGFRLTWDTQVYDNIDENSTLKELIKASSSIQVKFDGVHISHSIPNTVEFEGFIKFIKEAQNVGFAGGVDLRIPSTRLALDANLLIGMNFQEPAYPYLYVQFGIELPSGIPLAQSGLALKGAVGMLGMNVEPALLPTLNSEQNPYYEWYKSTPKGITSASKWRDKRMSFAFGAGVTITTIDGKVFGMKGLLALVVPGPIIMLEGKALIFDGVFPKNGAPKAIAFFNGQGDEKTVQFNIEASMQFGGGVVDVNAGIEAFFDFNHPSNWHVYIGKDQPKERHIHANVLNIPNVGWLFEGSCYLMLDMKNEDSFRARMGMKIGFEPPEKDLKVASVKMKAVLDGSGELSTNPFQFNGAIKLDAVLNVTALDDLLKTTINASAEVEIEGVEPLMVDANIHCMVDLPVPDLEEIPVIGKLVNWFEEEVTELPDVPSYIEFHVPFHWENNEIPTISPLIQDISVESHYVIGGGSINNSNSHENSLVVPLDAKPTIMFEQNMNNASNVLLGGFIDDGRHSFFAGKMEFKSRITEINLYRVNKKDVNNSASIDWGNPIQMLTSRDSEKQLWGMFRPEPSEKGTSSESRKILQLWSSNPFEFVNKMIPMTLNKNQLLSYTNSILKKSILSSNNLEKTTHCIDFKSKPKVKIVRIDDSYYKQLVIDEVVFQGSFRGIENSDLIFNSSALHIRFPKKVGSVEMNISNNSFARVKLYQSKGQINCKELILEEKNGTSNIKIDSSNGFDCMETIFDKDSNVNIEKICYISKSEQDKIKHWNNLNKINNTIVHKHKNNLLSFDSYYKLEVLYDVELSNESPGKFNYKDKEIENKVSSSEIKYFQTDGPPKNLRPYIKWTTPQHEYKTFFYEDDMVIRFNRSYIKEFYPQNSSYALEVLITDSNENILTRYTPKWIKSDSASLLIQEQEWYQFAKVPFSDLPKDDVLELIRPNEVKINTITTFQEWTTETFSNPEDPTAIPTWNHTNAQDLSINSRNQISSLYLSDSIEFNDYIFKFKTRLTMNRKDSIVGAVIEFESIDNFYYLKISKQSPQRNVLLQFFKVENAKRIKLAERIEKIPFTGGADNLAGFSFYVQKTILDKIAIKIFYNEQQVMNVMEKKKTNGKVKVGFYSDNSITNFSSIEINESFTLLQPKSKYNLQIKMNEKELYQSTFMTSSFSSFNDLISSCQGIVKKIKVNNTFDLRTLENLQKTMVTKKQIYSEKTRLYNAKSITKEAVEKSKQSMVSSVAIHNQAFLEFLTFMDNIAYESLPEVLTLYQVIKDNKILGILLRSPETLNPQSRTSFRLNKVSETSWISNGDGTVVFIYSNVDLPQSDTYQLTFTYIRDFKDDKSEINHLFDRAYELKNESSSDEVITINLKLD